MKKTLLSLLLIFALTLPLFTSSADSATSDEDMKAVWVSSVYNLDYPKKATTSASTLKKEAITILDNVKKVGLNSVILQVRPSADSLYKSEFFPWSKYLTGKQGVAPDNGFDPLEFWVSEAHKRNIELHAWINPFRITKGEKAEFDSIISSNPAKKNPSYVVTHSKNYYFNPGLPEVRKLIVDSTVEIVNNYDVDGIHLDDYFYPGTDFADSETFKKYGSKFSNISDWRRDNVNTLIKELDTALHNADKNIEFGVSPAGIWANKKNSKYGSETNGNQSYYSHYADTRKWVKDGIIDYIAPQIYWEIGHSKADYKTLTKWWADVCRGTGVKLYIGMPIYRAGSTDTKSPWFGTTAIKNQFAHNKTIPEINGTMLFRYENIITIPGMEELLTHEYKTSVPTMKPPSTTPPATTPPATDAAIQEVAKPNLTVKPNPKNNTLKLGKPERDFSTTHSKYYLTGSSDPSKPLTMNGTAISNRSPAGYWGTFVSLKNGKNTFIFKQGSATKTLNITKGKKNTSSTSGNNNSSGSSSVQSRPALTSLYPTYNETMKVDKKISLSATAPIGATVSAKVNGTTIKLTPKTTKKPSGNKIYATTFTGSYTIPKFTGNPRSVDMGKIIYTMKYNGKTTSASSAGKISGFMPGATVLAEVTSEFATLYFEPDSSDGSSGELNLAMRDMVTDFSGNYIKLYTGDWIHKSNVKLLPQAQVYKPRINKTSYETSEKYDKIILELSAPLAGILDIKDNKLTLKLAQTVNMPSIDIPDNSLISNIEIKDNSYILTLADTSSLNGYYTLLNGNNLEVFLIRKPKAIDGDKPLTGIKILIDPGHGGNNSGAVGSGGSAFSEKDVTWTISSKLYTKLENLGATVYLTRKQDNDPSLASRIDLSRKLKPDLLISVHANSLSEGVDLSKVEGLSVFYYNDLSKAAAKGVFDTTKQMLARPDKGLVQKKFFVTKGTWCPSYLYETGFVPNPNDYDFLTNDEDQNKLVNSMATATINYFK